MIRCPSHVLGLALRCCWIPVVTLDSFDTLNEQRVLKQNFFRYDFHGNGLKQSEWGCGDEFAYQQLYVYNARRTVRISVFSDRTVYDLSLPREYVPGTICLD